MSNHTNYNKDYLNTTEEEYPSLLGKKRKEEYPISKTFVITRREANSDNEDIFNTHHSPNEIEYTEEVPQAQNFNINNQLNEDIREGQEAKKEEDIQLNIKKEQTKEKVKKKKSNVFDHDIILFPSVIEVNSPSTEKTSHVTVNSKKKMGNCSQLNENTSFPWITPTSKVHQLSGMLKLHYEILDFYEFIKPTSEETKQREITYQYIKNRILSVWPEWKVKKFGSYPTQLNLPDSDIDLVLLPNKTVNDIQKLLKKISDTLIEENKFSYLEIIKAKVPIIKATFKETGINVDISVDRKNGYAAKGIIKKILIEYPYMRPLLYLLKYFLRQKNLNSSFTGGISSFVLFNLLYSYILYLRKLSHENSSHEMTLGHILVGFFQFFGFDFNYEKVGISIRYGGFFYKREEKEIEGRKGLLSMENFQDLNQDLGRSCFKFVKVIDAFKMARDALYYPSIYPISSYLGLFLFVDEMIIERYEKRIQFNNKVKDE